MTKNSGRIILAFIVGQIVQIILSLLAKVSYMNRPILFCIAAGFILLVAVFAGMRVIVLQEKDRQKTYRYYADGNYDE